MKDFLKENSIEIFVPQNDFDNVTESEFFAELTWVILASGFRVSVVSEKFKSIEDCFKRFRSSRDIVENAEKYRQCALKYFNNYKKISAIVTAAQILDKDGFDNFKKRAKSNPIKVFQELPYIGPITVYHLAKNMGFLVAKPDVHLTRIMNYFGYDDVQKFCEIISQATGDPIPFIDSVLWQYATIDHDYLDLIRKVSAESKNPVQQTLSS
jgi:N-glycosylase/DNA lyase